VIKTDYKMGNERDSVVVGIGGIFASLPYMGNLHKYIIFHINPKGFLKMLDRGRKE